ncbi:MAG TPA: transposase [Chloroflexota bacterium]|nr:transposase [Chloroflexota bacterium]
MLGTRSPQRGLFDADTVYGEYVAAGRGTAFYTFLAQHRDEIVQDEKFAELYCADNGRRSVPPSLLAVALILQTYTNVSDEEACDRACFDLRWKVALGVGEWERPFAKSTLQEFRAQLVLHERQAAIFQECLKWVRTRARQGAFGHNKQVRLALDTTAILGRGAVKDTYNLLGDSIGLVVEELAAQAGEDAAVWAEHDGFSRYVNGESLKGQLDIDWSDKAQREAALRAVVADADRVLELVRAARGELAGGGSEDQRLERAAALLGRVLVQDIERQPGGAVIKEGVSKDRVLSTTDPEMRHGRKSAAWRFDGYKAQVAVDVDTQLVTAVAVLPGNAPDAEQALVMVEQTEQELECAVSEVVADAAYGSGITRQAFADAGRTLVAKVGVVTNQGRFPKTDFHLDLDAGRCRCPANEVSYDLRGVGLSRRFQFAAEVCGACLCVRSACAVAAAEPSPSIRRSGCCKPPAPSRPQRLSGSTAPNARRLSTA